MPVKFLKIVIVVLITALCCFKIAAVCYARLIVDHDPQGAHEYATTLTTATLALNKAALREGTAGLRERNIRQTAPAVLKQAPMSGKILSQTAQYQAIMDDTPPAFDILNIALRREIHNPYAIKRLAYAQLLDDHALEAFELLDALDKTKIKAKAYRDLMANMSRIDIGWDALDLYLPHNPPWAFTVLRDRIETMSIAEIPRLQASLHLWFQNPVLDAPSKPEFRKIQQAYIDKMIKLGQLRQAKSYWQTGYSHNMQSQSNFIHDPTFKGSTAPRPFNWHYIKTKYTRSEFDAGRGLFVSSTGRKNSVIASQYLSLPASNRYQISVKADWKYKTSQGHFSWEIKCLSDQRTILALNMIETNDDDIEPDIITPIDHSPIESQASFVIPSDECDFQILKLKAHTGQYVKNISAIVQSVEIKKLTSTGAQP